MRLSPVFAFAAVSAALAACAPTPPPPGGFGPVAGAPRQCFFASTVSGFREVGNDRVNFRVSGRDVYQLELFGTCPELRGSEKVLLDSRGGGASVCSGLDVDLIVPTNITAAPRRCPGRSIRKLTETEVAALPAGQRP
jgi:hypothetical protein